MPLNTTVIVPYIIPYIIPFKEIMDHLADGLRFCKGLNRKANLEHIIL